PPIHERAEAATSLPWPAATGLYRTAHVPPGSRPRRGADAGSTSSRPVGRGRSGVVGLTLLAVAVVGMITVVVAVLVLRGPTGPVGPAPSAAGLAEVPAAPLAERGGDRAVPRGQGELRGERPPVLVPVPLVVLHVGAPVVGHPVTSSPAGASTLSDLLQRGPPPGHAGPQHAPSPFGLRHRPSVL